MSVRGYWLAYTVITVPATVPISVQDFYFYSLHLLAMSEMRRALYKMLHCATKPGPTLYHQ